jgi:hypothetical protein
MTDSNLTFYMMCLVLFMSIVNLMKNSFGNGIWRMSDETKMELLMGLKSFIFTFVGLRTLS